MCDRISIPEMTDLWQKTTNWQPNEQQNQQFQQLYEQILVGNSQFNLTRITDPTEFWEKHLWDSLRPILPLLQQRQTSAVKAIDIGTGAGFPGIPIAIAFPSVTISLLDSTRKKIAFIDSVIAQLNIANAQTLTDRAEVIGKKTDHRQTYDLATIRAVGSAAICAEYTLPLLKSGGLAVLYRGNWTEEEQTALQSTVKKLNGELASIDSFTTPLTQSIRHSINLKKL